jgi:hypothetical protein
VEAKNITDKISQGVEGLRDRTAEAIASDGNSLFRELRQLGDRIDEVGKRLDALPELDERVDMLAGTLLEGLEEPSRRTSWPRRVFWLALGAAVGAGVAMLTNPDLD